MGMERLCYFVHFHIISHSVFEIKKAFKYKMRRFRAISHINLSGRLN